MRLVLVSVLACAAAVVAMPSMADQLMMLQKTADKLGVHDTRLGALQRLHNELPKADVHPDIGLTTPQMIERRGYPAEIHYVTTADMYILQMHRIPNPGKPVVLLQHGLLCASSDWVMMGPELGLAYLLYDAGYDVWMGNARGNTYSRNHTFYDPDVDTSEFWHFSWNHMGVYDMPAVLDYVTLQTGEEQVVYVGHSMGTTMFWVMCSEKPKYNEKIKQMHALAPVAYMDKVRGPLSWLAPFAFAVEWITIMMGIDEFLPSSDLFTYMGQALCNDEALFQIVCTNVLFLIVGYDSQQLNETTLPVIMDHSPAGASTKTILHYAQEIGAKKFEMYNYGWFDNQEIYGSHDPPDYDLSKVTAPVYLHFSDNDWLAHPDDVRRLHEDISNSKGLFRVPFAQFNHLDFLWAIDVRPLLYDLLLELIANPLP